MSRKKQEEEEDEILSLSKFSLSSLRNNSKITFIGRDTNYKKIFKEYRNYFNKPNQVKNILEDLPENAYLVIDETAPNNKLDKIIFYYQR